jgi:hypothetical protein
MGKQQHRLGAGFASAGGWKRNHTPNELIQLACFGRVDPQHAGIDDRLAPMQSTEDGATRQMPALGFV